MSDNSPAKAKVNWERMFPDEFVALRDACPVVYAAYGLAEPHGPYNALGLDFLKAQSLLERAATEHGGIVSPPFAWHITELPFHTGSGGWFDKTGIKQPLTSSISRDVFYQVMLSQIRAFDARGFHAAILVTGHYGGVERTMRMVCEFYTEVTNSPMQLYACADWELINLPGIGGDHAGVTETSQLMALHEDLVDLSRLSVPEELGDQYAGRTFPAGEQQLTPNCEHGLKIINSQVDTLGKKSKEMLKTYQPRKGHIAPSVPDVEDLWKQLLPRFTTHY